MRKVCDEMSGHAKVITEEFSLANFQLQMGRPRREVLHDLGVRTGVDDVKSLAAILIQADRFGSSIAQALRVQSDSMRTRRKQLADLRGPLPGHLIRGPRRDRRPAHSSDLHRLLGPARSLQPLGQPVAGGGELLRGQ